MATSVDSHHHRNTIKTPQKSFKSRHASKGYLKDQSKGKVEDDHGKRQTKTLHQQALSKIDRRNQARQRQIAKQKQHLRAGSIFSGATGAPRIVAVVPLCPDGDVRAAIRALTASVAGGGEIETLTADKIHTTVRVERFRQNVLWMAVQRDLLAALDACRVADFVLLVLAAGTEVDAKGEEMLRGLENQGVSNVLTVVQDLERVQPVKRRAGVLASLKSYMAHFLPEQEKIHSLDAQQECANVVRSLCTITPKGVRWREDRSWMLIEEVKWPENEEHEKKGSVVLTGVVRGRNLNANRLVQVGDWGAFQIEAITKAAQASTRKRKADEMTIDDESGFFGVPSEDQDGLEVLAPEEIIVDRDISALEAASERRGVLLDEHHYFSDDETHLPDAPKKTPRGTSTYQSAWYLGDISDSGSDYEEEAAINETSVDTPMALPQDGVEGLDTATQKEPTEAGPSEYPQSEMFLDPSPNDEAAEIEEYRASRNAEADDDREFPDEIELHPNVLARERLARYRGLKSMRTSKWETSEDRVHQPDDWNRLLQISNYKGAKSQALREMLVGGIPAGTRVHIALKNVPSSLRKRQQPAHVLTLCSLLRHEQKYTVMNFSMTLNSDCASPIKAKDEILMQCGPRRLIIRPLFSQVANTPNNVHKFERYLHPGRTAMATITAPLTWGSVPALFFRRASTDAPLELIGTGTSLPPDTARVIAKRVILTGHPYKMHKKLVTVRYMFFNQEDVAWFKALPLWTKRGRSGFVKESLGTHGYFKATFDGRINPQDSVGVSLYKRVWPRSAQRWEPETEKSVVESGGEMELN